MLLDPTLPKFKFLHKPQHNVSEKEVLDLQYTEDMIQNKFVTFNSKEKFYNVWDSYTDFVDKIKHLPSECKCFHEVIFGNCKQKLKFDIDIKTNNKLSDDELNEILINIDTAIEETFFALYIKQCGELIKCCSTGQLNDVQYKYSYHIVVPGYCVENNIEARTFTTNFFRLLPVKYHKYVDSQVNKQIQNWRILDNKKENSHRVKKLMTVSNTALDTIITYTDKCELLPKITENKTDSEKTSESSDIGSTDNILYIASEYTKGHVFKMRKNNLFIFKRISPTHCELCDRVHHNDNTLMLALNPMEPVDMGHYGIYVLCRHAERGAKRLIGVIDTLNDKITVDKEHFTTKTIMRNKIENAIDTCSQYQEVTLFDKLPNDQKNVYMESKLRPFELTDTLCVKAAMKMGKTKSLSEYINTYYKDGLKKHKIIFVSFRQTFSGNIKERFKEFTLYSDVSGNLNHKKLIVQVESLHRIKVMPGEEAPDLLILDESESIFEQFNSGLLKKFNGSWAVFQWMVTYSKHVIAMDANLGDRTYRMINSLRCNDTSGYSIKYHCNLYRNGLDDTYLFTENMVNWLATLYEQLDKGKRIVIPTSSLSTAELVYTSLSNKYPNKYIKLYSSKTSNTERRDHFSDIHGYWSSYDVIIYTPTISAGISFEMEHFDLIFAYFTDTSCNVETCIQMLGRIRNVKEKKYIICLQGVGNNLPTEIKDIRDYIYTIRENLFKNISDDLLTFEYGPAGNIKYHENAYFNLWLENMSVKNKSANNFIQRIIYLLSENGATIDYLDETYDNDVLLQIELDNKELKKEINDSQNEMLVKSRELLPDEVEYIENKIYLQEDISNDDKNAYEKYKLRRDYHWIGPIDMKFASTYKSNGMKRKYKNMTRLHIGFGIDATHTKGATSINELSNNQMSDIIRYSLNTIREDERRAYIQAMGDVECMNSDLSRKYVYDQHRVAIGIINALGWASMYDKTLIPETLIFDNIQRNEKSLYTNMEDKKMEFNLKGLSAKTFKYNDKLGEKSYVMQIIKVVNNIIMLMYGARIKPCSFDRDIYMIKPPKHFATSITDNTNPCIILQYNLPDNSENATLDDAVDNNVDNSLDNNLKNNLKNYLEDDLENILEDDLENILEDNLDYNLDDNLDNNLDDNLEEDSE
jgi:hypothetical protein